MPYFHAKILCVDDQEANLVSLAAALRNSDHEIALARSGAEALEYVGREDFAVVLLDVQMPEMDGFETARLIRRNERSKSTPIIFLTANYPSEQYAIRGYESGAVDYLFKPLNVDVLRAKVEVFVDLYRTKLEIREIERRERERKYLNLVEGIRDGIVWSVSLKRNRFTFMSRRAEEITGYSLGQWLSNDELWDRFLSKETQERIRTVFLDRLNSDERLALEHQFKKPNGDPIWFRTEVHIEKDIESGERELRGLSVDITQLKRTEEALRTAIQIRDDFLSVASHELKTPITPLQLQMQGFVKMIEDSNIDKIPVDKLKHMLEVSDAQVKRLARVIGQLLDVTRLNEGRFNLDLHETELNSVVETVVEQLRYQLESSDCALSLDIPNIVRARVDRERMEQVLINLLINAMKYGSGNPIELSIKQTDQAIHLSVRDQGIGIAEEDQHRIFERFERAVSPNHYSGLGLGLYISKQIVELHKGSIHVESKIGNGSTFVVELPLTP